MPGGPSPDTQLAGLLCIAGVGLVVGTLVGAIILRAAVSLYNALAGGERSPISAPEPDFGSALGITFINSLVQGGITLAIKLATGPAAAGAEAQAGGFNPLALVSIPVTVVIMAGMLTAMLPTTFGRAILIVMCYYAVSLLVAAFILAVIFGFAFAMAAT